MKWRALFEGGACVVDDRCSGSVEFTGELDRYSMLYMVLIEQLLGSDLTPEALNVFEALAITTKGDYVNKLPDIFHCHPQRLEAVASSTGRSTRREL